MNLPEKYHYIELDDKLNVVKIHEFDDSLTEKQFEKLFKEHYELASALVPYDVSMDFADDDSEYFVKVIYVRPV